MPYTMILLNSILISVFWLQSPTALAANHDYYTITGCQGSAPQPIIRTKGKSVPFNQLFELEVTVPSQVQNLELSSFDAVMSAHNHGMVLKPKIFKEKSNTWKIRGLKVHMAGQWQLIFNWQQASQISKTICNITI